MDKIKSQENELRECFLFELSILKNLFKAKLPEKAEKSRILLGSLCTTGTAIYELSEKPEYFYCETIMLARSFIEKMTNFCYLNICEKEEYERFFLHPYYRTYHNSDKSKHAKDKKISLQFSGRNELKTIPKVAEALKVFSEKDPRMNWSNRSIDEKISLIAEKTDIRIEFFLMNTLTIYSNASEALHGSLYGCTFGIGTYQPNSSNKDPKEVEKTILENTALLFAQLISMSHETVEFLAQRIPLKHALDNSTKASNEALRIMKLIFEK
jgi:hypothetical protein